MGSTRVDDKPSPNCQYQLWVAATFTPVLEVKWVVSPEHPATELKSTVGGAWMMRVEVAVSLHPPEMVAMSLTV
jgi:hypothetical protein